MKYKPNYLIFTLLVIANFLFALADELWWLHGFTDHELVLGKAPWTLRMNILETGSRIVTRKRHFFPSTGITQLAGSYEIYAWQRRFEGLFLAQKLGPEIFYADAEYTQIEDSLSAEQYFRELENNYHGSENIYADAGFPGLRAAGILGQGQTVAVIDSCVPGPSVEFEHTQIIPLSAIDSCSVLGKRHGYHVSGTIAADCNGIGMAGVACKANLVDAAIPLAGSEVRCVEIVAENGGSKRVCSPHGLVGEMLPMSATAGNTTMQATNLAFGDHTLEEHSEQQMLLDADAMHGDSALVPPHLTTHGGSTASTMSTVLTQTLAQTIDEEVAYSGIHTFNLSAKADKTPMIASINHSYGWSGSDEWHTLYNPNFPDSYQVGVNRTHAFKNSVGVFAAGNLGLESYLLQTDDHLQYLQDTDVGLNLVQLKALGHVTNQTSTWNSILTPEQQKSVINVLNFDHVQAGGSVPDFHCLAVDQCKTSPKQGWFPTVSFAAGQFMHRTVVANGTDVWSTVAGSENEQTYAALSGTSMAAPQVSAAVALMKQLQPDNTPRQLADRIFYGATPASEAKCLVVDWQVSDYSLKELQELSNDDSYPRQYLYPLMQATNPRVVACDDDHVVIHTQRQQQDLNGDPLWIQDGTKTLQGGSQAFIYTAATESATVTGLVGQKEVVTQRHYDYQPVTRVVNDYVGFGFLNAARSALPIGGKHLPFPHASSCPDAAQDSEQDQGTIVGSDFGICSLHLNLFRLYKGQAVADLLALGDTFWLYRDSLDGAFYDSPSNHYQKRKRIASLRPEMVSLAELSGQYPAGSGWLDYHGAVSLHTKKGDGPMASVWLDRLIWRNETPLWHEPAGMRWKKPALSTISGGNADALHVAIDPSKYETAGNWHVAMGWGMPVAEMFTGSVSLTGYHEAENAYPVTLAPFTDGLSVSLAHKRWQMIAYAVPGDWSIRGLAEQYGAIVAYKWFVGQQVFLGANYEPNSLLNMQGSAPMDFASHIALHAGTENLLWATKHSAASALIDVFGIQARSYHDSLFQQHSDLWGTQWSLQWIVMDRYQNTWLFKLSQPLRIDSGTMDWTVPHYRDIYRASSEDRPIRFIPLRGQASDSARRVRVQASYDMKKAVMPFSARNIGLNLGGNYELALGGVHNVYDVQNASVWIRMYGHGQ